MVRKSKLVNTGEDAGEVEVTSVDAIAETMSVDETHSGEAVNSESDAVEDQQTQEDLENVDEAETERQLKREKNALLKDVAKIGEAYGAGKTSMISLAERVTESAMSSAIGVKDAELIYDRFKRTADARATLDDASMPVPEAALQEKFVADPKAKADGQDASRAQQLSKLRSFIKLGNQYQDDGLDIIRRARNVHLRMLQGDRKAVTPGSTYTILVKVATEQCKKDHSGVPMSDADIEDYLSIEPKVSEPATPGKKLLDALIAAEAAKRGSAERAPVTSDNLEAAILGLRAAIGEQGDGQALLDAHDAKGRKKEAEQAEQAAA